MDERIDPLTGGSFHKEFMMYVNYHGLPHWEAEQVMRCQTHRERDEMFAKFMEVK